jgi:putative ABC transport system permease protein
VSIVKALRARLRALTRRGTADRELREEIRFHLDEETQKNLRLGMSPDEARRVAVAHFGGVERVREEHHDVRRAALLEDFVADARFALRSLRRTPALAGAAIITLALGIGANVAIFSAVNAVVLQPLPFPNSDRLVVITEENPEKHWHLQTAAPANMLDWGAGVSDFESVMGYVEGVGEQTMTGRGEPRVFRPAYVTGNFFSTLGVHAALGRTLVDDDTWAHGTHVAVLSDATWRNMFGADPSIVGQSVVLDGETTQIVGVMPAAFSYPRDNVDLWQSVEWKAATRGDINFRRAHWIRAVARLRPGVTQAHANAQLQAVVSQLKTEYPETNRYMGAAMMPLHDFLIGDTRLPLLVLLTSVVFLLLIACANVGNLLLVQAAGREREATLRLALGAGRARLVRQALTESLILSALGGALGLFIGWAGTRAFVHIQPAGMLRVHDFGVDRLVLSYVVGISVLAGLLFGVAPALWMRQRDPAESLKAGGRSSAQGVRTKRWGNTLVISEVALALLMAVGAGLLVRSFMQITRVDPGFRTDGMFTAEVSLGREYVDAPERVEAFMRELETRARAIPGATDVALATSVPFQGTSYTSDFVAYGRPVGGYGTEIGNRMVSPGYFATMHVPVLRGRGFGPEDRKGSAPVVVINAALADGYFKGEDPVGQRITFDKVPLPTSTWYTIIGVVGSEHVDALDVKPVIEAFQSIAQQGTHQAYVVMHTAGDPSALAAPLREVVRQLDPHLTLLNTGTLAELRAGSLARVRFLTTMLIAFAVIGLTLSVVGVYGVLAQVSRNRTREMGIRIALGAQTTQVRWLVVRQGLRLTVTGLLVGSVLALFGTQLMTKLLFGVTPRDPVTLIVVAALLAGTSILAALIPARKASRADPMTALRAD